MLTHSKPAFVSERIAPDPGSADLAAMTRGEPGVPRAFTWRGQHFEVSATLGTRRDMGEDRGDVYVRRHFFEIETADKLRMTLYFERNPKDRSRRKAWWLYTVTLPEPVIVTERLVLRRWTYADRDDFLAMVSDPDTMTHLHDGVPLTAAHADEALRNTIEHYRNGYGDWAIVARADGAIMGESGLTKIDDRQEIELGYMLRRAYWGNGYATEAARAVTAYAFEQLGLPRVVALVRPGNARSIHVLDKLGMRLLGPATHRGHEMMKYEARLDDALPH